MAKFRLTRKAVQDLQNIWGYTSANWSRTQADKYYRTLLGACTALADNPASGRNYELIPEKYMGCKVGRHVIFYRIVSQDEIIVVRILHGRMDLKDRIRE